MVSEKELRETVLKKFIQIWKQKSILAKKGSLLTKGIQVATRAYGIRKQLPKTVTNETVEKMVDEFIKKEAQRGFTDDNKGDFYYRYEPKIEIMLEIQDEKTGKSKLFFDAPIVAIHSSAGFVPQLR